MGRTIAIANQKGGVGKTTTAINLSACLAEAGQRVLTIDFDPQGNATTGLGLEKEQIEDTVYELLLGDCTLEDCLMRDVQENLDVLPSDSNLAGAEIELLDVENKESVLNGYLETIRDQYDFIIIDCPPSLSLLTINALVAADTVLVPIPVRILCAGRTEPGTSDDRSGPQKDESVAGAGGVVFTMYDARTNLSLQVVENVKQNLNEADLQDDHTEKCATGGGTEPRNADQPVRQPLDRCRELPSAGSRGDQPGRRAVGRKITVK